MNSAMAVLADVGLSVEVLQRLAVDAEQAGFESMWTLEYEYDSFAVNQALLSVTQRLIVGSCVARASVREPLGVAHNALIQEQLAPGRYRIGLGSGPRRRVVDRNAVPDRPVARMAEYISVVRQACTEDRLSFAGEFFSHAEVRLRGAVKSAVPIFLAAGGPQMTKLAGRAADGMFVYMFDESEVRVARETALAAAGGDASARDFLVGSLIPTCVDNDPERARLALKAHLYDFYFHLPHYHNVLEAKGYVDQARTLREIGSHGDTRRTLDELLADSMVRTAVGCIPDEFLQGRAIAGTPDECRREYGRISGWLDIPVIYTFPASNDWDAAYQTTIKTFAP